VPGECGHNSTCQPYTCVDFGWDCGIAGDGCGGQIDCGECIPPETCGGGGFPGHCGIPLCVGMDCAMQDIECGPAGDGCGSLLDCGPCIPPDTCGGGGIPGHCGSIRPPA
jgi:hypothetical protein